MYAILIAGKDAGVDQAELGEWEAREGERYLWGAQNKALRTLETLEHSCFRPIDRAIASLASAAMIDGYVVVGSPDVCEYLGAQQDFVPQQNIVPQGLNVGENLRFGRQRLKELYKLNDSEFAAVISSDTLFADARTMDHMVETLGGLLEQLNPRPSQAVTFADRRTVGRLPRAYIPAYNDLTLSPPGFVMLKEANLQFVSMHTNYDMLNSFYTFRKQKHRHNQKGLLKTITDTLGTLHTFGLLAGAVRLGFEGSSPRFGISLRKFGEGMAELMGEQRAGGQWPVQLLESLWWQYSFDGDSEHDDARYDFTELPNLEYKLRATPLNTNSCGFSDLFGRRGFLSQYFAQFKPGEEGFEAGFVEPAVFTPHSVNIVTRWQSREAKQAFWEKPEFTSLLRAARSTAELTELGWFGG
jgi:heme-degrading monooxygenase HmoA